MAIAVAMAVVLSTANGDDYGGLEDVYTCTKHGILTRRPAL